MKRYLVLCVVLLIVLCGCDELTATVPVPAMVETERAETAAPVAKAQPTQPPSQSPATAVPTGMPDPTDKPAPTDTPPPTATVEPTRSPMALFLDGADILAFKNLTGDVMLLDQNTGDTQTLATGTGSRGGLAWSPDGAELAYTRRDRDTGGVDFVIVNLLPEPTERLAINVAAKNAYAGAMSWSPEGKVLLALSSDGLGRYYALKEIDPVSGGQQVPENLPWSFQSYHPSYSAAGDVLLYQREAENPMIMSDAEKQRNCGIIKVDLTTGEEQRVADGGAGLCVAPSGAWAVLCAKEGQFPDSHYRLYHRELSTGAGGLLVQDGTEPAVDAAGKRLAYVNDDQVWVMELATMQSSAVAEGRRPAWRPTTGIAPSAAKVVPEPKQAPAAASDGPGYLIAYREESTGTVYLLDTRTDAKTKLAETDHSAKQQYRYSDFQFSPDGTRLAFVDSVERDLIVVELDTLSPEVVTTGLFPSWWDGRNVFDWSPDSQRIAYSKVSTKQDGEYRRIFTAKGDGIAEVDLASGNVRLLTSTYGEDLLDPKYSPNGDYVSYSFGSHTTPGGVCVVGTASNEFYTFFDELPNKDPSTGKWMGVSKVLEWTCHAEWQDATHLIMDEVYSYGSVDEGAVMHIISVPDMIDQWEAGDWSHEFNAFCAPLPAPDRAMMTFLIYEGDGNVFPQMAGFKLMHEDKNAIPRLRFSWGGPLYEGLRPLQWAQDSRALLCLSPRESLPPVLVLIDTATMEEVLTLTEAAAGDVLVVD